MFQAPQRALQALPGAWRETLRGGSVAQRQRTPRHAALSPEAATIDVNSGDVVSAPDCDGNGGDGSLEWPGPEAGQGGNENNSDFVAVEHVHDDPGTGSDSDTTKTDSCHSTDTCERFWQDYQARTETREPAWQGPHLGLPTIDQPVRRHMPNEDAHLARRAKLKRLIRTRQIAAATKEALRHPPTPVTSSRTRPVEEFRNNNMVEDVNHSIKESLKAMGAQRRGLSEARKILEQVVEPPRNNHVALSSSIWSKIKTVRAQSDMNGFNDSEAEDAADWWAPQGTLVGFRMEPAASSGGA